MKDYIGISEDRMKHILGVARKCYKISKEANYPENFCRRMFMIGYLHDVGYEFAEKKESHAFISNELCNTLGFDSPAIKYHGEEIAVKYDEWVILNQADLQVNSKGEEVSVKERLKDIEYRYGESSGAYKMAEKVAREVGLL